MPFYHLYELNQAALHPARATADAYRLLWRNPLNWASHTALGRGAAAALELFERSTRRYRKPTWDIDTVEVDGATVAVERRTVLSKPFCDVVHFARALPAARNKKDPKVLVVAPMAHRSALPASSLPPTRPNSASTPRTARRLACAIATLCEFDHQA